MSKHKRVDEYDEYDKEDEGICDYCEWGKCICLDGEVENND